MRFVMKKDIESSCFRKNRSGKLFFLQLKKGVTL